MTPKIAPCLWFDDKAEEAAALYTGIFPNSRVEGVAYYPEGFDNPSGKPRGSVMTVEFELDGTPFTALNGGPHFSMNHTISFFALTDSEAEVDRIVDALGDGATFLMPLDTYPWSKRYAWVQDRFGTNWQVMFAPDRTGGSMIEPSLLFTRDVVGRAEEALLHYVDVFPEGRTEMLDRYTAAEGPEGSLRYGRVRLGEQSLVAMDSHLEHETDFNEGVSLQIICRDQNEVDHYWSALASDGEEGPCGWLKDRFGVSWQVVPVGFIQMLKSSGGRGAGYERAFTAMLDMKKLDLAAIEAAYGEEP